MSYKLTFDGTVYKFRSKDEVISHFVNWMSGDGAYQIQLMYPDGSYWGDDL